MAHRLLNGPEEQGWERSDFPIVCETCLGPNPYVRMQRIEYGGECHISKRPYTKFRWRPGSDARYKSTIICQEVAKAKNVCQVCLLDLNHNLPVQVRDQLTNAVVEDIPESEVGLEHKLALAESRGELGAQYRDEKDSELVNRVTRTTPYYKRNRAQICSFFVRGECKRGAECPYRHEMPQSGELAEQNIRDRYYGINDPVAKKMLRRLGERVKLEPPEDKSITTLWVGNMEKDWVEDDLREVFQKHGNVTKVKLIRDKSCAFVTYATREEAEVAADKLHDALIIHGSRCKLLWGKPQTGHAAAPSPMPAAGMPPAAPHHNYFGLPQSQYPSMAADNMGAVPAMAPGATGPPEAGPSKRHRPDSAPPPVPPGGPRPPYMGHMPPGVMMMRPPPPGMMRPAGPGGPMAMGGNMRPPPSHAPPGQPPYMPQASGPRPPAAASAGK